MAGGDTGAPEARRLWCPLEGGVVGRQGEGGGGAIFECDVHEAGGGEGGGECLVSGWCVRSALSMNFRSFLLPKLVE